jgi:hypothetical protein
MRAMIKGLGEHKNCQHCCRSCPHSRTPCTMTVFRKVLHYIFRTYLTSRILAGGARRAQSLRHSLLRVMRCVVGSRGSAPCALLRVAFLCSDGGICRPRDDGMYLDRTCKGSVRSLRATCVVFNGLERCSRRISNENFKRSVLCRRGGTMKSDPKHKTARNARSVL